MSSSKQETTSESTTKLPAPSEQELADRDKLRGMANVQGDAMLMQLALSSPEMAAQILSSRPDLMQTLRPFLDQEAQYRTTQQQGGYLNLLTPDDNAMFDRAYAGAIDNTQRQAKILADSMSGGRGLRMSDTPVTEAVSRETLPVIAQLEDAKAQARLNAGLGLAQYREAVRQANRQFTANLTSGFVPSNLNNLLTMQQNERFQQPTTSSKQTTISTPSPLQTATSIAGAAGGLAMGVGMGMGPMGAGLFGSGAGSTIPSGVNFMQAQPGWAMGTRPNYGLGLSGVN